MFFSVGKSIGIDSNIIRWIFSKMAANMAVNMAANPWY